MNVQVLHLGRTDRPAKREVRVGAIVRVRFSDQPWDKVHPKNTGLALIVEGYDRLFGGWWFCENLSDGFRSWHPPESVRLVAGG